LNHNMRVAYVDNLENGRTVIISYEPVYSVVLEVQGLVILTVERINKLLLLK